MDFLSFKSFISTEVLIIFYYIGAVILPFGLMLLFSWFIRKYEIVDVTYQKGKDAIWGALNKTQKVKFVAFLMTLLLFMELFWRMLFEFLIAYMQMRDAIIQLPL
jgi:hypothetical protein